MIVNVSTQDRLCSEVWKSLQLKGWHLFGGFPSAVVLGGSREQFSYLGEWGQGSLLEGPVLASGPDVALPCSCIIEVVLNSVSQSFHTKNQLIKYLPFQVLPAI